MISGQKTLESMSQAVWYNRWTLDKFEKYLSGDILEVGCGIGNFTKTLTKYGSVWAIDIEQSYVSDLKRKKLKKAHIGFGDVEKGKYFFKRKKFDSLICLNVLEHIKQDKTALSNMSKLLKNNGYLVLLVPSHPMLFGEIDRAIDHYRRYEKSKLINLILKNNFSIILSKRLNFIGAIGWWFAGKILKDTSVKKDKLHIFNYVAPFFLKIEEFIEPPFGTSVLIVAKKKG